MKKVGQGIRHFRKQRKMSQEELAHLAQVHESYMGKIERSEKVCSIEVLERVTGALGISLEAFFRYVQPLDSVRQEEFTMEEIVDQLRGRNEEEQKRVLRVIKALFEDDRKE
ncbi:helix-turn-helix transcriptional regulator [Paenibacillus sp. FSL H8-0048]